MCGIDGAGCRGIGNGSPCFAAGGGGADTAAASAAVLAAAAPTAAAAAAAALAAAATLAPQFQLEGGALVPVSVLLCPITMVRL